MRRCIQHRPQVPCDKVQIAAARARRTAEEDHGIRSRRIQHRLHERVAERENLLGFPVQIFRQRIGEKARRNPVRMVHIHKCRFVFRISAEEGGQTCTARIDIEPPVLLGRCVRVAFVGEIGVLEIVLCVVCEGEAALLQHLWEVGERYRGFILRRINDLEIMDEPHGSNFAECLIDEQGEHPPCTILVLLQERKEFFAADCEGDSLSLLREPDGNILHLDAVVARTQGKAHRGCTSDADVPVLPHGGGGEACEIDERKELCAHALGCEDQLIFRAALSKLE